MDPLNFAVTQTVHRPFGKGRAAEMSSFGVASIGLHRSRDLYTSRPVDRAQRHGGRTC